MDDVLAEWPDPDMSLRELLEEVQDPRYTAWRERVIREALEPPEPHGPCTSDTCGY